jgi:hypothetical protein
MCEPSGTVPKPYEPQVVHDRIRRLLAAPAPDRKRSVLRPDPAIH